jgi:hypothetical protein
LAVAFGFGDLNLKITIKTLRNALSARQSAFHPRPYSGRGPSPVDARFDQRVA